MGGNAARVPTDVLPEVPLVVSMRLRARLARWVIVTLAAASAIALATCGWVPVPQPGTDANGNALAPAPEAPLVVATTTFLADLAREIGGPNVRVVSLMKPGVDPHVYEPRPDDAILFRKAALILANGLHLEGNLVAMMENANAGTVEGARKAVFLAEEPTIVTRKKDGSASAPDPHVWWNASYFMRFAERVRIEFTRLVPEKKGDFQYLAQQYILRLQRLHDETKAALGAIPAERRLLITSHDAFYYFGAAYGVEVGAVLGISTEAQARAAEPLRLAEAAAKRGVAVVFHETSVSQAQNDLVDSIQRLAAEKYGHTLKVAGPLYSDSLAEPGSAAGSYIGAFKANVRMIVEGLSGAKAAPYFYEAEAPTVAKQAALAAQHDEASASAAAVTEAVMNPATGAGQVAP